MGIVSLTPSVDPRGHGHCPAYACLTAHVYCAQGGMWQRMGVPCMARRFGRETQDKMQKQRGTESGLITCRLMNRLLTQHPQELHRWPWPPYRRAWLRRFVSPELGPAQRYTPPVPLVAWPWLFSRFVEGGSEACEGVKLLAWCSFRLVARTRELVCVHT